MNCRLLHASALLLLLVVWLRHGQTLRQEAANTKILIGAAVNVHYLSEAAYASTLSREFNMLEPEDAMKWEVLRPDEQTFAFEDADRIVAFAHTHDMQIRGHNLVWGTHNPEWLAHSNYSSEKLSALLHDHISHVVAHFRNKVFAWDVVNEAFEDNGRLRDSIWYNQPGIGIPSGTAYIEQAFRWAREADPHALLFYNEAEAEELNLKSDAIYAMVKDFLRRGVPIDGIGLQMHIYNLNPNFPSIAANFARFGKLGIQIHITEMDVALPVTESGKVRNSADLVRQAEIYGEIVKICLQTSGCTAIQTWGVTDKYSWLGWATHHIRGAGLLLDRQYQAKPAYKTIEDVFREHFRQQN